MVTKISSNLVSALDRKRLIRASGSGKLIQETQTPEGVLVWYYSTNDGLSWASQTVTYGPPQGKEHQRTYAQDVSGKTWTYYIEYTNPDVWTLKASKLATDLTGWTAGGTITLQGAIPAAGPIRLGTAVVEEVSGLVYVYVAVSRNSNRSLYLDCYIHDTISGTLTFDYSNLIKTVATDTTNVVPNVYSLDMKQQTTGNHVGQITFTLGKESNQVHQFYLSAVNGRIATYNVPVHNGESPRSTYPLQKESLDQAGITVNINPLTNRIDTVYPYTQAGGSYPTVWMLQSYSYADTTNYSDYRQAIILYTGGRAGRAAILNAKGRTWIVFHGYSARSGNTGQSVFALRSRLDGSDPITGYGTVAVWENIQAGRNLDTVRLNITSGTNTGELCVSLTHPIPGSPNTSSSVTSVGTWFFILPRSFTFTPFYNDVVVFENGSLTLPIPSPPPPPVVDGFEPVSCPGALRAIRRPLKISADSYGFVGGLPALSDTTKINPDTTGIYGTNRGDRLALEFEVPDNVSIYEGESELNLAIQAYNITGDILSVTLSYEYLTDDQGIWVEQSNREVTIGKGTNYLATVAADLPTDFRPTKIRVIITLGGSDSDYQSNTRINVASAAWGFCYQYVTLYPSPPSDQTLYEEPQLPPAYFSGFDTTQDNTDGPGGYNTSPPAPPASISLDPGDEILRPNRDISVALWHRRPVWTYINEPVEQPTDDCISTPLLVEKYDENTGEKIDIRRPHLEVGMTQPKNNGPWKNLQLRFQAARSMPPSFKLQPPLPEPECKEVAPTITPAPISLVPIGQDYAGSWERDLLYSNISEGVKYPDGCTIKALATNPPGKEARLIFQQTPDWDGGYRRITAKIRTKATPAKEKPEARSISGLKGEILVFNNQSINLPEGTPNYEVRWEPLNCEGTTNAWLIDGQTAKGTSQLVSNIDVHYYLYLGVDSFSNLKLEVSKDGETWGNAVEGDILAFQSQVIYWRIKLNKGLSDPSNADLTPSTITHAIGLGLKLTGDSLATPIDYKSWPPKAAFYLQIEGGFLAKVDLTSQVRLKVRPHGNLALNSQKAKYTVVLGEEFNTHQLTWIGFWTNSQMKDLRLDIQATGVAITDDLPYIEIDGITVEVEPFSPGISPPKTEPSEILSCYLEPNQDFAAVGWNRNPAWVALVGDPTLYTEKPLECDVLQPNILTVGLTKSQIDKAIPHGAVRKWNKLRLEVQADLRESSSTKVILLASTNFTEEKRSKLVGAPEIFIFDWDLEDNPLSTEQIDRLNVTIKGHTLTRGNNPTYLQLRVVRVLATCEDFLDKEEEDRNLPENIPDMTFEGKTSIQIYACGSLGTCGLTPTKKVGEMIVRNWSSTMAGNLTIQSTGDLQLRIEDGLTQTLTASQEKTIDILAQVGKIGDPFPNINKSGIIRFLLTVGNDSREEVVTWNYYNDF